MTSIGVLITIGMGSSSIGVEGLATDWANFHLEEEDAGGMVWRGCNRVWIEL